MAKAKNRRNRKPSTKRASTRAGWDGKAGVFTSDAADADQLTSLAQLNAWIDARKPEERGGLDIRGRVIAQLGPFKDLRGEFDQQSLEQIVELGNKAPKGLPSNFKHRGMSDDNLGKHLGRDRDFTLTEDGKVRSSHFVLSAMAMVPPPEGGGTPYGQYVAGLAISDPAAFSSSLTLNKKAQRQLGEDGQPEKSADGQAKPDIWRPTRLWSIDVVSVGDAVDDFLSAEDGEAEMLSQATEMFRKFFDVDEITPEAATARLTGFAEKIVTSVFEEKKTMADENENVTDPQMTEMLSAQKKTNELLGGLTEAIGKLATPPKETNDEGKPQELSRDEFITKATALCKAQGKPEMLGDFLSDSSMTLDGVKDALLAANKEELGMDSDNDEQGGKNVPKKVNDKTPWDELSAEQVDSRLRKEYNGSAEVNERIGLSFDDFAKDRKIELGLASETSPILPVNKKRKAAAAATAVVLALAGLTMAFLMNLIGQTEAVIALSMVGVGMATQSDQLLGQDGHCRRVRRKVAASQTIYNGTITFLNAGLIRSTFSAGASFGGIAFNHCNNSTGADGDKETETLYEGGVELKGVAHGLTDVDIEKDIYASDNWTLTLDSANAVKVGVLKDISDKGAPVIHMG